MNIFIHFFSRQNFEVMLIRMVVFESLDVAVVMVSSNSRFTSSEREWAAIFQRPLTIYLFIYLFESKQAEPNYKFIENSMERLKPVRTTWQ